MLARCGLLMLALAAYSAACVAAGRRRLVPRTADLALAWAVALAGAVLGARVAWLHAIAAAAAGGAAAGTLAGMAWPLAAPEPADAHAEPPGRVRRFSRRMGNFQARLLLGAVYLLLVAPFALLARLQDDRFAAPRGATGRWHPRDQPAPTLTAARRQS